MIVLNFEALAIAYFTALAAAAPFTAWRGLARWRAALCSAALAALILAITCTTAIGVRVWLGHAYLVAGYWLPALLVTRGASSKFKEWLLRSDLWWRRHGLTLPGWLSHGMELSYLLCYLLVPWAFIVIWMYGDSADVDRFWTAVLAAGFVCYGTLPWLVASPPRTDVRLMPHTAINERSSLRDANIFVLARVSHGHNTFPSGHVAVSVASALMVIPVSSLAGLTMIVVAAGIAAGAVAGRYHYGIDVLLGIGIGIAASLLA